MSRRICLLVLAGLLFTALPYSIATRAEDHRSPLAGSCFALLDDFSLALPDGWSLGNEGGMTYFSPPGAALVHASPDSARASDIADEVQACIREGRLEEAKRLYEKMAGLGDKPFVRLQRAIAAASLIDACIEKSQVGEAEAFYDDLSRLHQPGDGELLADSQDWAALNLVLAYQAMGRLDRIQAMYGTLFREDTAAASETFRSRRLKIADSMVAAFAHAGRMDQAEAVHAAARSLERSGDSPNMRHLRVLSDDSMIAYFLEAGMASKAQRVYDAIPASDYDAIEAVRARAGARLVEVYGGTGNWAAAETIYKSLPRPASAIKPLAGAVSSGELPPAQALLAERAFAAMFLVRAYVASGKLDEAKNLYQEMNAYRNSSPARGYIHCLSIDLAGGLRKSGRTEEARAVYTHMYGEKYDGNPLIGEKEGDRTECK